MKKLLVLTLAAWPLLTFGQDANTIDQAQIDSWMGKAQQAQSCLAKIDQAEVSRVQAEAQGIAAEVQALCQAGNRSEAQTKAVAYGKKLAAEPAVLQLKECAGIVAIDIPQATWEDLESDSASANVCDIDM